MIIEIKNMIKNTLENAVNTMIAPEYKIPVEIPSSIEEYKLSHPIGAYLIIYKGSSFNKKDVKNIIAQDRDIEITVVVTARYKNSYPPENYLDFAISTLSGLEISGKRTDRRVYCKQDEWLGEEAGIWSYAATFVIPTEFFQTI